MIESEQFPRHRGMYRFRNPVGDRYFLYRRPALVHATCRRCKSQFSFNPDATPTKLLDEDSGGYIPQKGEIGGTIAGRGACTKCGLIVQSIQWPEAAYFQVKVTEGTVWAWNKDYLPALLARVSGDKVTLRHLVMCDWDLARFVSRLPRFAVLAKNRSSITKRLKNLLAAKS